MARGRIYLARLALNKKSPRKSAGVVTRNTRFIPTQMPELPSPFPIFLGVLNMNNNNNPLELEEIRFSFVHITNNRFGGRNSGG